MEPARPRLDGSGRGDSHHSEERDQITGSAGRDLYFVQDQDRITDLEATEHVQ